MACVVLLKLNLPMVTGFIVLCSCFFPLEVQDTSSDDHKKTKSQYIKSTSDPADPRRPSKRKAAIETRQSNSHVDPVTLST